MFRYAEFNLYRMKLINRVHVAEHMTTHDVLSVLK